MKREVSRLNDILRKDVKLLKALQGVSYKEVAEYLEIRQDSFYNWLKGYYEFSEERQRRLLDVIACLKE